MLTIDRLQRPCPFCTWSWLTTGCSEALKHRFSHACHLRARTGLDFDQPEGLHMLATRPSTPSNTALDFAYFLSWGDGRHYRSNRTRLDCISGSSFCISKLPHCTNILDTFRYSKQLQYFFFFQKWFLNRWPQGDDCWSLELAVIPRSHETVQLVRCTQAASVNLWWLRSILLHTFATDCILWYIMFYCFWLLRYILYGSFGFYKTWVTYSTRVFPESSYYIRTHWECFGIIVWLMKRELHLNHFEYMRSTKKGFRALKSDKILWLIRIILMRRSWGFTEMHGSLVTRPSRKLLANLGNCDDEWIQTTFSVFTPLGFRPCFWAAQCLQTVLKVFWLLVHFLSLCFWRSYRWLLHRQRYYTLIGSLHNCTIVDTFERFPFKETLPFSEIANSWKTG